MSKGKLYGKDVADFFYFVYKNNDKAVLVVFTDGSCQVIDSGPILDVLLDELEENPVLTVNSLIEVLCESSICLKMVIKGLLKDPCNDDNYQKALKICRR